MKGRVTLYVGGTTFEEVVNVAKFEDAKKTALARNPIAKAVSMNPIPKSLPQSKHLYLGVLFMSTISFQKSNFKLLFYYFPYCVLYLN